MSAAQSTWSSYRLNVKASDASHLLQGDLWPEGEHWYLPEGMDVNHIILMHIGNDKRSDYITYFFKEEELAGYNMLSHREVRPYHLTEYMERKRKPRYRNHMRYSKEDPSRLQTNLPIWVARNEEKLRAEKMTERMHSRDTRERYQIWIKKLERML
ncbi:hypothetical protein CAPTEDRAFT_196452 [Capitella teleta]|uniref:Uncharacterized protein n=1 Tax=Capitella teleta TaxID=283909 RepID=R7V9L5_CAPTE|nr:hypothetical protein CAPTEDRAFT_196452 [Capitella teleta]|eukprot:ELU12440.1 hypothetical protein CAPTEDRAFT_196452 [Capitella teleta]